MKIIDLKIILFTLTHNFGMVILTIFRHIIHNLSKLVVQKIILEYKK